MKTPLIVLVLCASVLPFATANAADKDLAAALAAAGCLHAAKGNLAVAKEHFFKALANDEQCPDAIFELAKIFDKDGNTAAAADFFQRAVILYSKDPKAAAGAKRAEATTRVKALNPFAPRMSAVFEDYALELDKLVKKNADAMTKDSAMDRVGQLKLSTILPPEKMPKFHAVALAEKEKEKADAVKAAADKKAAQNGSGSSSFGGTHAKTGTTAPDVEKELKALGWATIKGSVVKKGPGVYEVKDALLEAPKTNGAINFTIIKEGSKGTVKATARTVIEEENRYDGDTYSMPGYGFNCGPKEYKIYGPSTGFSGFGGTSSTISPYSAGSYPTPETPKSQYLLNIIDGSFEFFVNDKKVNKLNHNKTPKTGTFVIDVIGTVIIESPRCMGQ